MDPKQKHQLATDFKAQVFAVRKLREHFLLGIEQEAYPNKKNKGPKLPQNEFVNMSQEALEELLKEFEKQLANKTKHSHPQKFMKEDIENQLKIVRRREYYYKKVKEEMQNQANKKK